MKCPLSVGVLMPTQTDGVMGWRMLSRIYILKANAETVKPRCVLFRKSSVGRMMNRREFLFVIVHRARL